MRTISAIVEFNDVGKTFRDFRGSFTALHGLSFAVEPGSIVSLLGPNGAGKSTAIRMLATLSKPTSGSVSMLGTDVARFPQRVRPSFGYVGQNLSVDSYSSVAENIAFAARLHDVARSRIPARVASMLSQFDLSDVAQTPARKLSGGLKRRLDLAMGVIHEPSILLLDEPTVNLDPDARRQLWSFIAAIRQERDLTVVFTTHYLEEADQFAQYVVFINEGRRVAEGTPAELKRRLSGETLIMEFSSEALAAEAAAVLEELQETAPAVVAGSRLLSTVENASSAIPIVLGRLSARNLTVRTVSISKPSLDDVYMMLTGKSFEEADKAGTEARLTKAQLPWQ